MHRVALDRYRADNLERMADGRLDVLIIGGGIVGAGVARDAAMRGLRVGLVEQHDLAFGTSSRSSRLLHGGLRYLAQGRIGLVREASREKCILQRIAPHLCDPLPLVFPTYRGTSWPLWKLRIGVKLYDLLCGGRNLGSSGSMGRDETLEHLPGVNPRGLTGAVRYFDGLTNDARLVLDTLRSAAASGAVIANYTRLQNATAGRDGWLCQVRDVPADRPCEIAARTVVHATGPWAEILPQSSVRLRLTKGIHLVIDRGRLPIPEAVVTAEGDRILFALPWLQRVILGSTDTDYDGPPEDVCTEPADVQYVLGVINETFPSAGLTETDVLSSWAGVRPLIAGGRGRPSDVSRAHQVHNPQPGWFDVAGGKLTTYRLIAQQVVDRLVRHLGVKASPCRTAEEPLLPPEATEGLSQIVPPAVTAEAVEHYCTDEWSVHLDDVMVRRSSWHYYRNNPREVAQRVAGWMGEIFAWDDRRREAELARYRGVTA